MAAERIPGKRLQTLEIRSLLPRYLLGGIGFPRVGGRNNLLLLNTHYSRRSLHRSLYVSYHIAKGSNI